MSKHDRIDMFASGEDEVVVVVVEEGEEEIGISPCLYRHDAADMWHWRKRRKSLQL